MKLSQLREQDELCVADLGLAEFSNVRRWHGDVNLSGEKLTSLRGSPSIIIGDFNVKNNFLTDWSYGPSEVHGDVYFDNNSFTNFHNIHEHLKVVKGVIWFSSPNKIKSHVLGFLMIEGLLNLNVSNTTISSSWVHVIEKHLTIIVHTPKDRRSRLYDCQQALIDAELDEFAQL